MTTLVVVPMLVVLATATVALVSRNFPRLQRAVSVVGTLAYAVAVGALVRRVVFVPDAQTSAAVAYQVGGWEAPFGITLVADGLSVFMLSLAAAVAVFSVVFSVFFIDPDNQRVYYHTLFQFLLLGVTGAFLTGDLFNLFVWFEVILMVSYVFVAFYGDASHTAAATRYVVLNIVGGVLMLIGVGGLYATVGTLNMADMARVLSEGTVDTSAAVALSALVFAAFALKAGLVPFQFWVPSAYRAAPLPVTAMFAGVTKKVGVYAILRLYFTVFGGATLTDVGTGTSWLAGRSALVLLAPVLLTMGVLSIVVGGVGAVRRDRLDGLLAYSSIGQVGFIVVPIAVAAAAPTPPLRRLSVVAALVYALHHALTKGMLFLSTAVVRDSTGTTRLSEIGGMDERSSVFMGTFFIGSLSLIGVPPLTGFFGKLLVFEAAVDEISRLPAVGVSIVFFLLVGAFLTVVYSTRAFMGVFRGTAISGREPETLRASQVTVLGTLALLIVVVGVGFEPVYRFADAAAKAAVDTEGYVEAVLGGEV